MTRTTTADPAELIGAYALDAVEVHERNLVERALKTDSALRRELDEYHDTLSLLVAGFEESPPRHVWETIQSHIAATTGDADVIAFAPRRHNRFIMLAGAVAAVLALVLGVRVVQLDDRIAALEAGADDAIARAAGAALTSADATVAVLAGAPDTGIDNVTIVFDRNGLGYVFGDTLPALGATATYQLWAITGDALISAGVLGNDPGIAPFQIAGGIDGLAITVEQAGGVVSSTEAPAALWEGDA